MNTSYIYSATRVTSLGNELLSQNDIDRLLVATPGDDLQSALKETYLASYVLRVPDEDVRAAIEMTLIEAKELIQRIAPDGTLFNLLWIQYDIHNLRVFAKATAKQLPFAAVEGYISDRGMYDPVLLHRHVEAGTLDALQAGWQGAYDAAVTHVENGKLDLVDEVFDVIFFSTLRQMVAHTKDEFLQQYVVRTIDLHNLKNHLRALRLTSVRQPATFVMGGTFSESALTDRESTQKLFEALDPELFGPALEVYVETGNTTELDARVDDYMITFSKDASRDLFSSASIVLYYLRVRQAAANIRTVVVGRNSGMEEKTIRANIRTAYVNN